MNLAAHTLLYAAGALALAAIIHTTRAQWPAVCKLLEDARNQGE